MREQIERLLLIFHYGYGPGILSRGSLRGLIGRGKGKLLGWMMRSWQKLLDVGACHGPEEEGLKEPGWLKFQP